MDRKFRDQKKISLEPVQRARDKLRNLEHCHGERLDYMNYMNICQDEDQRMKGTLINVLKKWLDV
jgi:hypothetical protein